MDIRVNANSLSAEIAKILEDYRGQVFERSEDGLDAAEEVLRKNLEVASPRVSGNFAKNWKSTKRKYKAARFVKNDTMVKGKSGNIPLSKILEFSTVRGKPFIIRTYNESLSQMAEAYVTEIKKG